MTDLQRLTAALTDRYRIDVGADGCPPYSARDRSPILENRASRQHGIDS